MQPNIRLYIRIYTALEDNITLFLFMFVIIGSVQQK